jgi:hypothetical protein
MRRIALLLATLSLASCGYGASRQAHEAQISMIGMTAADLTACAGPPAKTTKLNPSAEVDTYTFTPPAGAGFNLTLPLDLGGITIGGPGSSCITNVRLVDNRVTEVHYTGPDDLDIGNDGVCDPVIRGCMRQPEASMQPVTGKDYDDSSAYTPPAVPPQPPGAQESNPPPVAPVTAKPK